MDIMFRALDVVYSPFDAAGEMLFSAALIAAVIVLAVLLIKKFKKK